MVKLYNLARMTTATTGTGTITLGSAVSGFRTFADAGASNGETVRYGIRDGANSEMGYGVYTSSGTTLTRNVISSTNANSAINLSGAAEIFIAPTAEDLRITTTRGDLIRRGSSVDERLALGTSGYLLSSDGTDAVWAGFLQAGTGAATRTWQSKVRDTIHVRDFGAVGDGTTDDRAAIQAAIDYAKTLSASVPDSSDPLIGEFIEVDLGGSTYALLSPLSMNDARFVRLKNGRLIAIDSGATNWTTSNAMIDAVDTGAGGGTYGTNAIYIEAVQFDCKRKAQAIRFNAAYRCAAINVDIVHQVSGGYAIAIEANCNVTRLTGVKIHEDTSTDIDGGDHTRAAGGVKIASSGDVYIDSSTIGWLNEGVTVTGSSKVFIVNSHIYCGSLGTAHTGNLINIDASSNNIVIHGNYLDSGYLKTASNSVLIDGNNFYWNGATYSGITAYIWFTTAVASTYIFPRVTGTNNFNGGVDIFKSDTTGGGSFVSNATKWLHGADGLTQASSGAWSQDFEIVGSYPKRIISAGDGSVVYEFRAKATAAYADFAGTGGTKIAVGSNGSGVSAKVGANEVFSHVSGTFTSYASGTPVDMTFARTDTHGVGYLGYGIFRGKNASGTAVDYAAFTIYVDDDTAGAEDSALTFQTQVAGTKADRMVLRSGLVIGSATGGDKGAGTLNAVGVYDDNTLLTCYVLELARTGLIDLGVWRARGGGQHAPAERFAAGRTDELDIAAYAAKWRASGHLPGFPSPDEWAEGAKSTGDMVQRLWETVELQAVHIDSLHNRLTALEAR